MDVWKPQRMLGAGRKEDIGDVEIFTDVAIQVRCYQAAKLGIALRSAAFDARTQSANGNRRHYLGLVPYPGARTGSVRWIAAAVDWPTPTEPVAEFALVTKALAWVRTDAAPHGFLAHPRRQRLGTLLGSGAGPVLFAPLEAWLESYRSTRGGAVAPAGA